MAERWKLMSVTLVSGIIASLRTVMHERSCGSRYRFTDAGTLAAGVMCLIHAPAGRSASGAISGSDSTCGQPSLTVSTTVVSANAIVDDSQLDLMPSGSTS